MRPEAPGTGLRTGRDYCVVPAIMLVMIVTLALELMVCDGASGRHTLSAKPWPHVRMQSAAGQTLEGEAAAGVSQRQDFRTAETSIVSCGAEGFQPRGPIKKGV